MNSDKNERPQVSVILPVYNGLPYLDACLRSIADSRGVRFEVIVGDDGSSDGSSALIDTYRRYPWFRVERGSRRGLFANLNRLLEAARGELIHILCQDDMIEPHGLAEEVDFFSKHPEIAMSFCKSTDIDRTDRIVSLSRTDDLPEILTPNLAAQHFFYHGCIPGNLSTVCLRAAFVGNSGFDTSFQVSADYEMWTRLCRQRPLGVIQKRLVRIRLHPGQLSAKASSRVKFLNENRRIRERLLPYLPQHLQASARAYEKRRHDAIDFHSMFSLALHGKFTDATSMFRDFGLARLGTGAFYWLVSLNNRLYRPQAQWVFDDAPGTSLSSSREKIHSEG